MRKQTQNKYTEGLSRMTYSNGFTPQDLKIWFGGYFISFLKSKGYIKKDGNVWKITKAFKFSNLDQDFKNFVFYYKMLREKPVKGINEQEVIKFLKSKGYTITKQY